MTFRTDTIVAITEHQPEHHTEDDGARTAAGRQGDAACGAGLEWSADEFFGIVDRGEGRRRVGGKHDAGAAEAIEQVGPDVTLTRTTIFQVH